MSAPIGNKNALGNQGGGRKSAYDEIKEAEWLADVWNCDQDVESLRKKIEDEKVYSIKDMLVWKALNGNERALKKFADAIFPKKIDLELNEAIFTPEEVEEHVNRLIKLEKELRSQSCIVA